MTTTNVLTITLNPSIDMAYYVDDFEMHEVNRVREVVKTAGGKGINVSKVLNILGVSVTATGYTGGYNGALLKSKLEDMNIPTDFVDVPIETRNCINISSGGNNTEVLENTNPVDSAFRETLLDKLAGMDTFDYVVVSGSCIDGIPKSIYYDIIKLFNAKNIPVILDVSADVLSGILNTDAEVLMIKPNEDEQRALMKSDAFVKPKNVQHVVISKGVKGLECYSDARYTANAPDMTAVNPVGSGDASIAGFIYGYEKSLEHALKCMVAAGSANAAEVQTGHIKLTNFNDYLENIEVTTHERFR